MIANNTTIQKTPCLRRQKLPQEAANVRNAIIEGYEDAVAGCTVAFTGDLKRLLAKAKT